MPRYEISVSIDKGGNIKSVQAAAKKLENILPKGAVVIVSKDEPPSSRADRLAAAESSMDDAKSEVESLRDELQDWYDNLPENLQSGSKADELQEAIDALESLSSDMESLDFSSVTFPGMY